MRSLAKVLLMGIVAFNGLCGVGSQPCHGQAPPPISSVKVRLGYPYIVMGPMGGEGDSPYSEVALPMNRVRAFPTSFGHVYYTEAPSPLYINGTRVAVTGIDVAGTAGSCGNWLQSVALVGNTLVGLVHNETLCSYPDQTHKSVSVATSSDLGKTWTNLGTSITGSDAPAPGKLTGIGDCSMVVPGDGYLYAYCLRQSDWQSIAVRASVSNYGPGGWWKWTGTAWSSPGLGGGSAALSSDSLGFLGTASALWDGYKVLVTPDWGWGGGGIKMSFSVDGVTGFQTLNAPLSPAGSTIAGYLFMSMLNRANGSSALGSSFLMAYTYMPYGAWEDRYLVMQGVTLSTGDASVPTVLLPLTRWYSAANHDRWTTTGPTLGVPNPLSYGGPTILGYLLSEPTAAATVPIDECLSSWTGHSEHLITNDNGCRTPGNGYDHGKTIGWAYPTLQPGTVPFFRCFSSSELTHFASLRSDCDGLGSFEWTLGYLHAEPGSAEGPWY